MGTLSLNETVKQTYLCTHNLCLEQKIKKIKLNTVNPNLLWVLNKVHVFGHMKHIEATLTTRFLVKPSWQNASTE